jgi:hypothetical protein
MQQIMGVGHRLKDTRPVCRAAAASFTVGLVALRVCWLPGVNCVLAAAAITLGAVAAWQITRSRGALCGVDEAISGVVLGVVVLGLSVFFVSALVAAYRR